MIRIIAIAAFVVGVVTSPVVAQVAKIYPVDEAAGDAEFFAFRARLFVALQQRNVNFLYSILADGILNSFGGDGGIDEFKATWKPEEATSKVWGTLTEILALRGQFQTPRAWGGLKMFVAPYFYSVKPSAGFDPFEYGVVVGRDVSVRQQPNRTSAVLANLAFDVVRVTDWTPRPDSSDSEARTWIAVRLADDRAGYVASEYVRSRIGYRAIFVRRDGRWLLRALVAGD